MAKRNNISIGKVPCQAPGGELTENRDVHVFLKRLWKNGHASTSGRHGIRLKLSKPFRPWDSLWTQNIGNLGRRHRSL